MVDSPKSILLRLDGIQQAKLPAELLGVLGIQEGGIVEVEIPRFPRVGDVKRAVTRALGIPAADQVLRGPLPRVDELSCDWALLWELEVLPGLSEIPAEGPAVDEEGAGGSTRDTRARRRRALRNKRGLSVQDAAVTPGELFSTANPVPARVKQERGRMLVSDILQLSTLRPMADYFPGGRHFQQRVRMRFLQSLFLNFLIFAAVLAAAIFILWQVPGYELPKIKPSLQPLEEDGSASMFLREEEFMGSTGADTGASGSVASMQGHIEEPSGAIAVGDTQENKMPDADLLYQGGIERQKSDEL